MEAIYTVAKDRGTIMKIFSDRSYLPPGKGHIVMLYPFWGKNPEDPRDPSSGRFDRYTEIGGRFFQMTSLEEANFAVFPGAWEHVADNPEILALAERFIETARAVGKPTVLFFCSDSDEKVPYTSTIVFRTSLYHSQREPTEFSMPAWSEDFVHKWLGGRLLIRQKRHKPVVGFCGAAASFDRSWKTILKNALKRALRRLRRLPPHGGYLRAKALRLLQENPYIETNFILRDRFYGGAKDNLTRQQLRLEYVHNMVGSDYILCVRGVGNFSYRLYETLCSGRIPVFVNTDCVLPYDFLIQWKKYCVWVEEHEVDKIAERVVEFHERLSPSDFVELQHACRKLWEEWLSPEGFFANFYRHFEGNHRVKHNGAE